MHLVNLILSYLEAPEGDLIRVYMYGATIQLGSQHLLAACRAGDEVAVRLVGPTAADLIEACAQVGRHDMFGHVPEDYLHMETGARAGHLNIVQYFVSLGGRLTRHTLKNAIESGNVDTASWVASRLPSRLQNYYTHAIGIGRQQWPMLNWLWESGYQITDSDIIDGVKYEPRVAKWLMTRRRPSSIAKVIRIAVANERRGIILWCMATYGVDRRSITAHQFAASQAFTRWLNSL